MVELKVTAIYECQRCGAHLEGQEKAMIHREKCDSLFWLTVLTDRTRKRIFLETKKALGFNG